MWEFYPHRLMILRSVLCDFVTTQCNMFWSVCLRNFIITNDKNTTWVYSFMPTIWWILNLLSLHIWPSDTQRPPCSACFCSLRIRVLKWSPNWHESQNKSQTKNIGHVALLLRFLHHSPTGSLFKFLFWLLNHSWWLIALRQSTHIQRSPGRKLFSMTRCKTKRERSFAVCLPSLWNNFTYELSNVFKIFFKTTIFQAAFV